MPTTTFASNPDGFAFNNDWTWDATEKATVQQIVADAMASLQPVLLPTILSFGGPALAAEAGVPVIGPWLVSITIDAIESAFAKSVTNAIETSGGGRYGLCGGMAFTALDYWLQRWVVPRGKPGENSSPATQPDHSSTQGAVLRDYIWKRLLQSLTDNAGTFLEWMAMLLLPGAPGAPWLRNQTLIQLGILRTRIDAGTPVPLGLVGSSWSPTDNHQLLAIGYEDLPGGKTTLTFHDSNHPLSDSSAELSITVDLSGPTLVQTTVGYQPLSTPLLGFFCTVYTPAIPPKAVVLDQGLTVSPLVTEVDRPIEVQFTAKNVGFDVSPSLQLAVVTDDPAAIAKTTAAPISQGDTADLDSPLTFSSAGTRRAAVLAFLTTGAGQTVSRVLPPGSPQETPVVHVTVLPHRSIVLVKNGDACAVGNVLGQTSTYAVEDVSDLGPGVTYQWSVVGAVVQGDTSSPQVVVQMPNTVDAQVTIQIVITRPDGIMTTGTEVIATITPESGGLEHAVCALNRILTGPIIIHRPGGDPWPNNIVRLSLDQLSALSSAARTVHDAAQATLATLATAKAVTFTLPAVGALARQSGRSAP